MDDLLLYGGPGCGKTTAGLGWLMRQVERGADLRRVAFVSYTKAAVSEGVERVSDRFQIDPDDMPYSRTLHSLALKCLQVGGDWNADRKLREFADGYGYDLKASRKNADEEGFDGIREATGRDGGYLKVWDFGRHRMLTEPDEAFSAFIDYDPDQQAYVRRGEFLRFVKDYEEWKNLTRRMDFTDLLVEYLKDPVSLPVSVAVIDEAQDLSPLMWRVADALFADAEKRATLGDDDQAIYSFSGADPRLMNDRPTRRKVKLSQSHRLPEALVREANRIIEQNHDREPKELCPQREGGTVQWARDFRELPLDNDETWFLLVRNWKLLSQYTDQLGFLGLPYRVTGDRQSPWNDNGAYRAAQTLRALGEQRRVTLREVWDLAQHTPSANSKKSGVWVHGSKKQLEGRAAETPEEVVGWRDLLDLGMTQEAFLRVMQRDLKLLEGRVPTTTLTAYQAAVERGHWGTDPRITLGSVHSVKGKERDHVAVLSGCSYATYRATLRRPQEERRVAYVAVTRARSGLYVLPPCAAPGVFPWEALA